MSTMTDALRCLRCHQFHSDNQRCRETLTTHTPGPWTMVGREVIGQAFDGTGRSICVNVRGGTPQQADANARLIAAAPELLGAARMVLVSLEAHLREDGGGDSRVRCGWGFASSIQRLTGAIAKAEGAA